MAGKISANTSKAEQEFLNRAKKFPDRVILSHTDSVIDGFEYFETDEYLKLNPNGNSHFKQMLFSNGLSTSLSMIKMIIKFMPSMMRGRKECFTDLNPYLDELEQNIPPTENPLIKSYPNTTLWEELKQYAWDNWKVTLGYTQLPSQLVFKGKAVLFKYSIVAIQEMDKDKIDLAPKMDAGMEVQRIYNGLGLAVNDIARWLRKKYNIKCQSNHPLGGLVDTSPLAVKAGMGWQGHNGLLVTPQYGQRQRIAPIFIEENLFEFTNNKNHAWMEDFCKTCRKCEKSCPSQAIYSEKKPAIQNIPDINQTRTCIDRTKCFPYFSKTMGCSICLKVCPFSKGGDTYNNIKKAFDKKNSNKVNQSLK